MAKTQTDNGHLSAKLKLREYFLEKYHSAGDSSVLDCCQGDKTIWRILEKKYAIKSYWGVDVKKKKGRLKIDSVRILQQEPIAQNIIDIDTYGAPWNHWFALLENISQDTTVFLTIGSTMQGGSSNSASMKCLGIDFKNKYPASFRGVLSDIGSKYSLAAALRYGIIIEALESVAGGNARYIGIRIQKTATASAN